MIDNIECALAGDDEMQLSGRGLANPFAPLPGNEIMPRVSQLRYTKPKGLKCEAALCSPDDDDDDDGDENDFVCAERPVISLPCLMCPDYTKSYIINYFN